MGNSIYRQLSALDYEQVPINPIIREEITPEILQQLIRRGLNMDLALNPFQMHRQKENCPSESSEQSVFHHTENIKAEVHIPRNSIYIDGDHLFFQVDALTSCKVFICYETSNILQLKEQGKEILNLFEGIGQKAEIDCKFSNDCEKSSNSEIALICSTNDSSCVVKQHISLLRISKREDSYHASVSKQILRFNNPNTNAFAIKEIFGRQHVRRSSSTLDGSFYGECVVCMTNIVNSALLPCRHMCLCEECAVLLKSKSNRCPICRTNVSKMVKIDKNRDFASGYDTFIEVS
jgi:hypothetical protein